MHHVQSASLMATKIFVVVALVAGVAFTQDAVNWQGVVALGGGEDYDCSGTEGFQCITVSQGTGVVEDCPGFETVCKSTANNNGYCKDLLDAQGNEVFNCVDPACNNGPSGVGNRKWCDAG